MSSQSTRKKSQSDPSFTASENRRLRNRLSQKAHRARQSIYIKELEKRLECTSMPESALSAELAKRNAFFRGQLLDCQKKLESMQASIKSLSDSVSVALNMELSGEVPDSTRNHDLDGTSGPPTPLLTHDAVSSADGDLSEQSYTIALEDTDFGLEALVQMHGDKPPETETQLEAVEFSSSSHMYSMDHNDFFLSYDDHEDNTIALTGEVSEYTPRLTIPLSLSMPQMDSRAYKDLSERGSLLLEGQDCHLRRTNSPFSDHIAVFEYFLRKKWEGSGGLSNIDDVGLSSSVSFMVSMFITMSWPRMTAFYSHTKAHHAVVKLTTWRLNPTARAYRSLGSKYTPSHTQLFIPHPTIIDWIPWASMRDKLVLHHAADPHIDDIVCDIGNSFVAECDVSDLVAGVESMTGYVGVWDLVAAISPETTLKDDTDTNPFGIDSQGWSTNFRSHRDAAEETVGLSEGSNRSFALSLPAPNVAALFSSRSLALQAFKKLDLDKGSMFFKLDPAFFERHPHLYDERANILARGVSLRPPNRSFLPSCKPLDEATLGRYRECATWTFDLSFDGLIPTEAAE